jgi:putative salt-induced outer membrane protein
MRISKEILQRCWELCYSDTDWGRRSSKYLGAFQDNLGLPGMLSETITGSRHHQLFTDHPASGENFMRLFVLLAVTAMLTFGSALSASADTVVLQNGDHVTGTFVSADGKTLAIKTPYEGQISLKWPDVTQFATTGPVYVTTSSKRTLTGTITKMGDAIVVQASTGAVTVPLAEVTTIRSQQEQDAYEASLHPPLSRNWAGGANMGFTLARGNSNTTDLTTSFTATRKTLHDLIGLSESSVYTTATSANTVTANAILGGAQYHRNLTPALFAFVSADYIHDELQGLNLRQIYSAGLGWHVINNPNTTFDLEGGLNYTRESYSGTATLSPGLSVNRNIIGVTTGEDFTHRFNKVTSMDEHFFFYPDLSDTGQYRFTLMADANTKLSGWLSWQVSLNDIYVSNPPIPGTKTNDVILSTGLGITFHH